MTHETIASPCINICVLNLEDVCEGCYRTADEITEWMSCDNARKKSIFEQSQQRLKAAQSVVFK